MDLDDLIIKNSCLLFPMFLMSGLQGTSIQDMICTSGLQRRLYEAGVLFADPFQNRENQRRNHS